MFGISALPPPRYGPAPQPVHKMSKTDQVNLSVFGPAFCAVWYFLTGPGWRNGVGVLNLPDIKNGVATDHQ